MQTVWAPFVPQAAATHDKRTTARESGTFGVSVVKERNAFNFQIVDDTRCGAIPAEF